MAASEVAAIGRIATAGWKVTVRADFDPAGIRHVAALLAGVPGSTPWRMGCPDFSSSQPSANLVGEVPSTPWDPNLRHMMTEARRVAFEEALMGVLLDDIVAGRLEPVGRGEP